MLSMKKLFLPVFMFGFILVSLAQETELRKLSTFRGIKAAEGIDVYLKKGIKEEVRIEATGIKLSNVITEVSGEYLKIHLAEGNYRNRVVKVYVSYVSIDFLAASSGANIYHEGILKSTTLDLRASSGGAVELKIDVGKAEAHASSAGEVVLDGIAKSISLDASSGGEIDAYNLASSTASAEASSGGDVKLSVSQSLFARASSGGSIRYRGNPEQSNTNSSSGGSVKKSN